MDLVRKIQSFRTLIFFCLALTLSLALGSILLGGFIFVKMLSAQDILAPATPEAVARFVQTLQASSLTLCILGVGILIFGFGLPAYASYRLSKYLMDFKDQVESSLRQIFREFLANQKQSAQGPTDSAMIYAHFVIQAILSLSPYFTSTRAQMIFDLLLILKGEIALYLSERSTTIGK